MILAVVIFFGIGALLIGLSARSYYLGCLLDRWEECDGVITQSEFKTARGVDVAESQWAAIEYEFEVAGQKITSRSLSFGIPTNTSKAVEGILHRYPVGKQVTVLYDPRKGRSILERGITEGTWFMFGIGIVFVAVAFTLVVRGH